MVAQILDLEKHISIMGASTVDEIIRPLREALNIKFFRYLKLYKTGKRIVLSNMPDAIRYMYGQGNYANLWYDGEFPEFLKEGWHFWHLNRLLDKRKIEEDIENSLTSLLGVYHGITYVKEYDNHWEIYSFDAVDNVVYQVNKNLLLRFIYYFREQAKKLMAIGEMESIVLPIKNLTLQQQLPEALITFLDKTKINRYYLGGKYHGTYLTAKEAICVRWMIEGKTADEIAIIEGIHSKTVQHHIENIKLKLNCSKQTQIIRLVLEAGFFLEYI